MIEDMRIEDIRKRLTQLPKGSIGKKTVNGKIYYYHRWQENGKRIEKYIPKEELEPLRSAFEEKKKLQDMLYTANSNTFVREQDIVYGPSLKLNVFTGKSLLNYSKGIEGLLKRECFNNLESFLKDDKTERILILYGLRRTGKTTIIRQAINSFSPDQSKVSAFIQVTPKDTLADMNHDLRILLSMGFKYVFIDEVTLIEDFIEGAALFSDIYAASGMKIVLSGTDSLGFLFAREQQLYDRCLFIHTTFIPYREFENVLGVSGIDEYISYGGTMSLGGLHYNMETTFSSKKTTDEYIDSSIANNIQHSLKHYQFEGHFRALQELYENNELTGAINRVVEDINHRFTVNVLTKAFNSTDLSLSARNLRNDRLYPTAILDEIDTEKVTQRLITLLEIKKKEEQKVHITPIHAQEIKEYMDLLDLTFDLDVLDSKGGKSKRTAISQPGLRYCQVQALVESLLQDKMFSDLSINMKTYILDRIKSEVRGRMMEDIVLLETKKSFPEKQGFKLQFAVGEYDMVIFDSKTISCQIFEIKHSKERDQNQIRFLTNDDRNKETEFKFGKIERRCLIYRGENTSEFGVQFINVEDYLKSLR